MARERSLREADEGRWSASPNLVPDVLVQLDDVVATLGEMIHHRGAPPAPASRGPGSPGVPEAPEHRIGDPEDREGPGTLPLLRDVVAPTADDEAAGPEADEPAPALAREPWPPRFEILPEEPPPYPGGRGAPGPDADPDAGGERYGDAPPPSPDPGVYRHLIERIANEIDVIVQTGTEEAMQRAAVEIAARVREHLAITLPEVIGEIVRMSSRPDD